MAYQDIAKSAGRLGGKYVGKFFGMFFIFIFIIIPLLYALIISIQAGSIEPGFSYIAPKLIAPIQTLEAQSLIAIEQEGTYVNTGRFFADIWNFIVFFWLLIGSIYIIYKWNKVLYKAIPFTPWSSNDSNKMVNVVLAITIFIIIQMIFLGSMAASNPDLGYWEAVNTPFRAVWTFGKALPFMITEATHIIDWDTFHGENNTLNETIANVSINDSIVNIVPDKSNSSIIVY